MGVEDPSPGTGPPAARVERPPPRRRRRIGAWLAGAIGAALTVVALTVGVVIWSLHQPAGSAWLLGWVPGLTLVDPKGSLCLLYTSDAADERSSVDLGGR